jgi:uracil-DNA glycosylase family 4
MYYKVKKRHTYIPPSGNPDAKIVIVGEQPGRWERDKIFTGSVGQALDECLNAAGIQRFEVYLTNVIKDKDNPLKYYIDINNKGNHSISKAGHEYIQELREEILKLPNVTVIVAFGDVPLLALCSRVGINNWRGSIIESTLISGIKVIPILHPLTIIPPKCNYLNKPLIITDFQKVKRESEFKKIYTTTRKLITQPNLTKTLYYLEQIKCAGLEGKVIGIDIEVVNKELDCIGFSFSKKEGICIPFKDKDGNYFTPDNEIKVMDKITEIIENPNIAKVGANFIFDMLFLYSKYGIIPQGELHCTQIAQKIYLPDYKASLAFVTNQHTDMPYYKADGKDWMKMNQGTWEKWWNYNTLDAIIPVEAIKKQLELLKKQGNTETYDRQRKLIYPLTFMAVKGIRFDLSEMRKYKKEQEEKLKQLVIELRKEVGYVINHKSPKQVAEYFYEKLKLTPYKKRSTNGEYTVTTDFNALKRIARQGIKAANLMLQIRTLAKQIDTYLKENSIDDDGRMRSSYNPVGAETGRLSSSKSIFGKGLNFQNIPHKIFKFFKADKGYIVYSLDLSQIENRVVAYVGNVKSQMRVFEAGKDMHVMTATFIFKKPYEEISDEEGSASIGDGTKSERDFGKKGNHANNYKIGYKTFALQNEIPENKAKIILIDIDKGYPEIELGYRKMIREILFKDRVVTNLFGRKRLFLGPIRVSKSVGRSSCEATFREAYAHFAQSTCADKTNEHGVNFIYYNQQWFKYIELLNVVHDSVVFQIPLSIPLEQHAKMLIRIKKSLETPLFWTCKDRGRVKIETPVDLSFGFNMYKKEMCEIKSRNFSTDVNVLKVMLKERIEKMKG